MSNGPDLNAAVGACHAARSDIREMHADDDSAKVHHKQADKETQNAKKAEGFLDVMKHMAAANDEKTKGDAASKSADQHRKDAFKHLGDYNAAMGRDPTKGTPATGRDGPDCKPAEKALANANRTLGDIVKDAMGGVDILGPHKKI
jgi:hypothetical protein